MNLLNPNETETSLYKTREAWEQAVRQCSECPLRKEGNRGPVLSTGDIHSPLMIIGEGPGGVEDDYGAPLVGPSGQLLDKALASVGITRDRVYVTNIVKCRPHGNRTPTIAESADCADRWLYEEIRLCGPKAILALGKTSLRWFAGKDMSIVRSRGKWLEWKNIPVMPTFHPAYLLRQTGHDLVEAKWQVYYDLKAAKEKATEAAPDWTWKTDPPPDLLAEFAEMRAARHQ